MAHHRRLLLASSIRYPLDHDLRQRRVSRPGEVWRVYSSSSSWSEHVHRRDSCRASIFRSSIVCVPLILLRLKETGPFYES